MVRFGSYYCHAPRHLLAAALCDRVDNDHQVAGKDMCVGLCD
jgi:hypothetical protein